MADFHRHPGCVGGVRPQCKDCWNAKTRKYRRDNPEKVREAWDRFEANHPETPTQRKRRWERENPKRRAEIVRNLNARCPEKTMLNAARSRAKQQGVPFGLKLNDITIPEVCPILGIPLRRSEGTISDNSPSLDKVVPALGYVPGNVNVISARANRLKSNASRDELAALLAYVDLHIKPRPRRPKRHAQRSADNPPLAEDAHDQSRQPDP